MQTQITERSRVYTAEDGNYVTRYKDGTDIMTFKASKKMYFKKDYTPSYIREISEAEVWAYAKAKADAVKNIVKPQTRY